MNPHVSSEHLRQAVRDRYGRIAAAVAESSTQAAPAPASCDSSGGCCAPTTPTGSRQDPISADLYDQAQVQALPQEALLASLGCGNPTALAELRPGEVVLDLGSGGGIDVLLSARRVGPGGFAYGLDMTDEMLALAEQNRARAGAANVQFLKGAIEDIPLPDQSVDVVISNCVINLSADKDRVLREAHRVLKPGGRFAVSDVVVQGNLPPELRSSLDAWAGCVAGALEEQEYRAKLAAAGFDEVEIQVTRRYDPRDLAESSCCGAEADALLSLEPASTALVSAFVRARKP